MIKWFKKRFCKRVEYQAITTLRVKCGWYCVDDNVYAFAVLDNDNSYHAANRDLASYRVDIRHGKLYYQLNNAPRLKTYLFSEDEAEIRAAAEKMIKKAYSIKNE